MSGIRRPRVVLALVTSLCALALLGSTLVIADGDDDDNHPRLSSA